MPDGKRKKHYLEPMRTAELERLHAKTVEPTMDQYIEVDVDSTTSCTVAGTYRNLIADADSYVNLDLDIDIVEQPSQGCATQASQADSVGIVVRAPSYDHALIHRGGRLGEHVVHAPRSSRRAKKRR
jgi:hypothetical protein